VRFIRFNADRFDIDPARIGMIGFSAGGHLSATAGTHFDRGTSGAEDPVERMSSRPDALVLCYPWITLKWWSRSQKLPEEFLREFSDEEHVTADTPPTFIYHTANDPIVPVTHSLIFAEALSRHGVPFDLHVFSDGPHGTALARENPTLSAWTKLCETWLKDIGFIGRAGS
jgi:acetyl esterase/lipase